MSEKNFISFGDSETIFAEVVSELNKRAKIFRGSISEWNALTTDQKKNYDKASIPNSIDGGVTFPANKVIMTGGGNVEDAVDGLTVDTGWIQIGTSNYYYRKVGKVVWVKGSVDYTNGSWTITANLPSGYRPTFNLYETLLINVNSYVSIEINKNGNIETISTFPSGTIGFMKSFLTD